MRIDKLEDFLKIPISEALKLISHGLAEYPSSLSYEVDKQGRALYISELPDGTTKKTGYPDNPALKSQIEPFLPRYSEALRAYIPGG